jgi:hypothetical protein
MTSRALRKVASSWLASNSRINCHSGECAAWSSNSSEGLVLSAPATCKRIRTEALPTPSSRLPRCRSDTSAADANSLRVIPRPFRTLRIRSPSWTRKGCFSPFDPSAGAEGTDEALPRSSDAGETPDKGNILLDMKLLEVLKCHRHHSASDPRTQQGALHLHSRP